MRRLLLCTDLDRTLLPNGDQPESAEARKIFKRLAGRDDVNLVYATGRDLGLTLQAIEDFDLPTPEVIIADVGTAIFLPKGAKWQSWTAWEHRIGSGWGGQSLLEIEDLLGALPGVLSQEREKQGPFKLSFYVPLAMDQDHLQRVIDRHLERYGIGCNLIWSVDETTQTGLLDIVPAGVGKLPALRFVMDNFGYRSSETVFAGDSGNDLEVLCSDIAAILVANAHHSVRERLATTQPQTLYLAKGGYLGMNGNYSAGILEGVAHFRPHIDSWLRQEINNSGTR